MVSLQRMRSLPIFHGTAGPRSGGRVHLLFTSAHFSLHVYMDKSVWLASSDGIDEKDEMFRKQKWMYIAEQ